MGMIIQSILLPKGVSMEALLAQKGLEWLSEANIKDKKEFERYTRFEQLPAEKFDKGTLNMTRIGEHPVWVIGGAVLTEKDAEKALTLSTEMTKKLMELPVSPMDQTVTEIEMPSYQISFREVFEKELMSFLDVVTGVMGQTGMQMKGRKDTIMKALDAFGSFLSMSIDAVGKEAVKLDKFEIAKKEEGGERQMELFKTKEEFEAVVLGIVQKAFAEMKKADEEKAKAAAPAIVKVEEKPAIPAIVPNALEAMEKTIQEMAKTVKETAAKTELVANQLAVQPTPVSDPPAAPTKTKEEEKPSIFKGIFRKQQAVQ